jgi:uncharacterized protein (DUF1778 family)
MRDSGWGSLVASRKPTVGFRLTRGQKENLERRARLEGVSVSEFVVRALGYVRVDERLIPHRDRFRAFISPQVVE